MVVAGNGGLSYGVETREFLLTVCEGVLNRDAREIGVLWEYGEIEDVAYI